MIINGAVAGFCVNGKMHHTVYPFGFERRFMKSLHLVFLILLSVSVSFAQPLVGNVIDASVVNNDLIYGTSQYKGDPYLMNQWSPVVVTLQNGEQFQLENGKFDICSQKLLVEIKNHERWMNEHQLESFMTSVNEGEESLFMKKTINKKIRYQEVIYLGEIGLFRDYEKEFKQQNQGDLASYGGNAGSLPYFTETRKSHYLSSPDNSVQKIRLNRKGLEKSLPEHYQHIFKRLVKEFKTDFGYDSSINELLKAVEAELP